LRRSISSDGVLRQSAFRSLHRRLLGVVRELCELRLQRHPLSPREHRDHNGPGHILLITPIAARLALGFAEIDYAGGVRNPRSGAQEDGDTKLLAEFQRKAGHIVAFLAVRRLQHRHSRELSQRSVVLLVL